MPLPQQGDGKRVCAPDPCFSPFVWRTGGKQDGVFIDPGKEIKLTSFRDINCPMHYCNHCRKFIVDEDELNT